MQSTNFATAGSYGEREALRIFVEKFPRLLSLNKFRLGLVLARWLRQMEAAEFGGHLSRLEQALWYLEQDGVEIDDSYCLQLFVITYIRVFMS